MRSVEARRTSERGAGRLACADAWMPAQNAGRRVLACLDAHGYADNAWLDGGVDGAEKAAGWRIRQETGELETGLRWLRNEGIAGCKEGGSDIRSADFGGQICQPAHLCDFACQQQPPMHICIADAPSQSSPDARTGIDPKARYPYSHEIAIHCDAQNKQAVFSTSARAVLRRSCGVAVGVAGRTLEAERASGEAVARLVVAPSSRAAETADHTLADRRGENGLAIGWHEATRALQVITRPKDEAANRRASSELALPTPTDPSDRQVKTDGPWADGRHTSTHGDHTRSSKPMGVSEPMADHDDGRAARAAEPRARRPELPIKASIKASMVVAMASRDTRLCDEMAGLDARCRGPLRAAGCGVHFMAHPRPLLKFLKIQPAAPSTPRASWASRTSPQLPHTLFSFISERFRPVLGCRTCKLDP